MKMIREFCDARMALGVVIVCSSLLGQESNMAQTALLKAISDNDRIAFDKAVDPVIDKSQFARKLIDIVKATNSSEFQKCASAFILGKERYVLAVNALTDNILLENKENSDKLTKEMPMISQYPACTALCEIGYPAANSLVALLIKTGDKAIQDKCILVLSVIFGRDRDMVKTYLMSYCKKCKDADKSNDYDEILKRYTEPYEGAPKPGNTDSGGRY